jgi:HEAT repeat protein
MTVCVTCSLGLQLASQASDGPPVPDQHIQQLIDQLKKDGSSRHEAANALGKLGPKAKSAIPALIEALQEKDDQVLQAVAAALGAIGKDALQPLMEALKSENPRVRAGAVFALGKLSSEAQAAAPALSKLLSSDNDFRVRRWTARALGEIGAGARDAVPVLLKVWKDPDKRVAEYSEDALDIICQKDVSPLIQALKHEDPDVRAAAAEYLGKSRPRTIDAIRGLVDALKDRHPAVRLEAAKGLAKNVIDLEDVGGIPDLERAVDSLNTIRAELSEQDRPTFDEETVKPVRDALDKLKKKKQEFGPSWLGEPWAPWVLGVGTSIGSLLVLWSALLWLRPLWLLSINDTLRPYTDFQLPERYGNLKVSLRAFLLVGFFNYRPRVLDAWVAKHITAAREHFFRKDTVQQRAVRVPIPVICDGTNVADLKASHLRPTFAWKKGCLLIWGEGGSGKTSLACQVMKWAMAEDREQRLCEHLMLPVLIEMELDFPVDPRKDALEEAIRGQLQALITEGEPIPVELFERLLRTRRILVCVDHFSEMREKTRKAVRPGKPEFSVNALIVTSRKKEPLDGVPCSTIQPLLVEGNRLSSFMEAYLTLRGKRQLFDDAEYFDACRRLSVMVGGRKITALLAKLYADQCIDAKEGGVGELPDSIPDLMLSYLNELNRGATASDPDDPTVHRDLKVIAWQCMRETYRPVPAPRDAVLAAMKGEDPEKRLKYLEDRLRIIKTTDPDKNHLRVVLDPLTEYLAGFYLVENYGANEQLWREFLRRADSIPGGGEAIRGFLLAVRDCCVAKGPGAEVPNFVTGELAQRALAGS